MATDTPLHQSRTALTLAALGVVFGDIGTSPLYAVKETFAPGRGISITPDTVLGGLSLIFWALMVVVSLKYVVLIMRADNRGEGGIMALTALATASIAKRPHLRTPIVLAGICGAALFYGDAVLTPAISVLSAVEGLEIGTSAFQPYVVPIAVVVLVALFAVQRHGTALVGRWFGPVSLVWFLALGAAGLAGVISNPSVLAAVNPLHAVAFAADHGFIALVVLGAVVLAVTGAEALYADMGHFGKAPIRIGWFSLVGPALVLNYFGQGALLLADPLAVEHPFYHAYPSWALYPMVVLATLATVIASQATISGAYSLTKQAVQLGFLPRMNIVHTSAREAGQIYIPAVNWILLAVVLAAVIGFGSSSRLASAYGFAVTATMLVDTVLAFFVIRYGWNYPLSLCIAATGFFLVVDLAFLTATALKLADGAWFPLATGLAMVVLMTTWRRGRGIMVERLRTMGLPLTSFLEALAREPLHRVPGTAVFLTATPDTVPRSLLHNLNHNKVLHERVVFLTVNITDEPWVPFDERVAVEALGRNFHRVTLNFGFKNRPDVAQALTELCPGHGLPFEMMETSFFLSRETVIPVANLEGGMALWRERLFAAMARNAGSVVEYFNIPTNRVIELGTQVEI